ncbi:MAG: rRNA maturation RNase YbeY [Candidatus Eremiobacteraeota bacterium]|nr:rRNA maturation RNase YbeY [Candidatus Eremiobacteraeota bacterium]
MTTIKILVDTEGSPKGRFKTFARTIAKKILEELSLPFPCELSLMLVDDETIRRLNREHRGKDTPTDVLAFPMEEGHKMLLPPGKGVRRLLGDVVISLETARRQAEEHSHPVKRELAILIAHGILHLRGYDDDKPGERAAMEKRSGELLESPAVSSSIP